MDRMNKIKLIFAILILLLGVFTLGCVSQQPQPDKAYPISAEEYYSSAVGSTEKLIWPIDCKPGVNCNIFYPEINKVNIPHKTNKIVVTFFHVVPGDERLKSIKNIMGYVDIWHTATTITKEKRTISLAPKIGALKR